jgi:hypothetical protein
MESIVTNTSSAQLMQAVEQLNSIELNHFANEVAIIRARRNAPVLSPDESALFAIINRGLSERERERLKVLTDRRANETLTSDEHEALLKFQQKLEALHAARMKALAELAALRGLTLTAMMDQLGIHFPDYE